MWRDGYVATRPTPKRSTTIFFLTLTAVKRSELVRRISGLIVRVGHPKNECSDVLKSASKHFFSTWE
jgi:hypothetical protein